MSPIFLLCSLLAGLTVARAVPPYLCFIHNPYAFLCHAHVCTAVHGGVGVWGRVVWSVCFVTRVGCLSLYTPRQQALVWAKGRDLGHTGLSFLDVTPPPGPAPGDEV